MHTVVAADGDGRPIRVDCGFCHSEHNYRGGARQSASSRARLVQVVASPAQGPTFRPAMATRLPYRANHRAPEENPSDRLRTRKGQARR